MRIDLTPESARDVSIKALCYKTVDVFAGICERKLWLKDGEKAGTDGHLIVVPFRDPYAYQYTEHEISHILFKSNALAREVFLAEYVNKIRAVAKKAGVSINDWGLNELLKYIVAVLDDERVISLWGRVYRGSEAIMRRMKWEQAKEIIDLCQEHESLMGLMVSLAARHDVRPGELDRYRPYMEEALARVRGVDYTAMLAVAKWFVVQLVSEMIRESRQMPPGLPAQRPGEAEGGQVPQGGGEGASAAQDEPGDDGPPSMPWEQDEPQGSAEVPSPSQGTPPPDATPYERTQALGELIKRQQPGTMVLPDEVEESRFKRPGEEEEAKRQARKALNAAVQDEQTLDKMLSAAESTMDSVVEKAQHAARNALHHDDRLRKDAYAKVVFTDVEPSPHRDPHLKLDESDEDTVRRLRALFHRVLGRRVNMLDDAGVAIDVPAYLTRRLTGEPLPVFRADRSGRGFRALVLIDRSSSMEGRRTKQAERACRIISRALDFPFVTRHVWGFQGLAHGQVDIIRFRPGQEVFDSDSARVGGITPLHTAIRVALQELEDSTDAKHLFVVSDGFPVFARKDGAVYGTHNLMAFVRSNVMGARQKGIGVTGVMIGGQVGAKAMTFMFGPSKYWRQLDEKRFGDDLVQLVSGAFIEYLRSR